MSTKVIYRSGMRSIGGTIIEVIHDHHRIIFDFGINFDPNDDQEVLPNVSGIYDNTSTYDDLVIISHTHLDHVKALNLIDPHIKILMSYDSKKMLNALKATDFKEIKGNWRDYDSIDYYQSVNFGSFKITAIPVDHDVPGSVSFLIENEDVNILYTGDLRFHGINKENTIKMVQQMSQAKIDLLIIEGVGVSFIDDDYQFNATPLIDGEITSDEYVNHCLACVKENTTILFNIYIMNVELFYRYYQLAQALNYKLVLLPQSAYIFKEFMPYFKDNVYVLENDAYNSGFNIITYQEIDDHCLVQFNYHHKEDYLKIIGNKTLIQSGGEPIGAFDARYQILQDFCANHNINFCELPISGHSLPDNLAYIIENINPQILSPIHSYKPEMLCKLHQNYILPNSNDEYEFVNHHLEN